jgi:hypothetical protein
VASRNRSSWVKTITWRDFAASPRTRAIPSTRAGSMDCTGCGRASRDRSRHFGRPVKVRGQYLVALECREYNQGPRAVSVTVVDDSVADDGLEFWGHAAKNTS